jgi:hypothetical protein
MKKPIPNWMADLLGCDWNQRETVKRAKVLCFWIGIGFFFVCAVTGMFSSMSVAWNVVSGIAFIVALIIEILAWNFDKRCEILDAIAAEQRQKANDEEIEVLREFVGELEQTQNKDRAESERRQNPSYDPYNPPD